MARLIKRVFEFNLEYCQDFGSELKIIAAILEASVIDRILTLLGLRARAPPQASARHHRPEPPFPVPRTSPYRVPRACIS